MGSRCALYFKLCHFSDSVKDNPKTLADQARAFLLKGAFLDSKFTVKAREGSLILCKSNKCYEKILTTYSIWQEKRV